MLNRNNFSPNEQKLIDFVGISKTCLDIKCYINPISIWEMMVKKAFALNMKGPEVEAIRRGFIALESGNVFRMSPEFEAIIEIK